jgi:hypothetical protein
MDQEQVAVRSFTSDVTDNVEPPRRVYRQRRSKATGKNKATRNGTLTANGRLYTKLVFVDGTMLRTIRKKLSITLQALSEASGVSYVNIQRIETQPRSHTFPATLDRMAQVLGVPVAVLTRNDKHSELSTVSA